MTKIVRMLMATTAMTVAVPAMSMAAMTLPSPIPLRDTSVTSPAKSERTPAQTERDLRNGLQAVGYSDIQQLSGSGRYYTLQASYDGQLMPLRVDAATGRVSRLSSSKTETMAAAGSIDKATAARELDKLDYNNGEPGA